MIVSGGYGGIFLTCGGWGGIGDLSWTGVVDLLVFVCVFRVLGT